MRSTDQILEAAGDPNVRSGFQILIDERSKIDKLRRRQLVELARRAGVEIDDTWPKSKILQVLRAEGLHLKQLADSGLLDKAKYRQGRDITDEEVTAEREKYRRWVEGQRHFAKLKIARDLGFAEPEKIHRDHLVDLIVEAADTGMVPEIRGEHLKSAAGENAPEAQRGEDPPSGGK